MYAWNSGGLKFLDSLTAEFTESGLLDWLHGAISDVWAVNMDRYEPEALGDTAGAFGILSAHNIRQRAIRASQEKTGVWADETVRATDPEGSLLIRSAGVNIHVLKAPRSGSRTPAWERDFKWDSSSYTRLNAALRNTSDSPTSRGPSMQDSLFELPYARTTNEMHEYSDVFVVWSGQEPTGLTAAWLGIPVMGPSPWIAVSAPLWLDQSSGASLVPHASAPRPSTSVDFAALEEPKPRLRLKTSSSEEELK
jgi:hypothetical protein